MIAAYGIGPADGVSPPRTGSTADRSLVLTLLVFARKPLPGRCKTRLIPRLGARGAAWVQRRLLERLLKLAAAVRDTGALPLRLVICAAPDSTHPHFAACRAHFGALLQRQPRGDLGRRMRTAIAAQLRHGPVLLAGSDAWGLSEGDLVAAATALRDDSDYVLVPADDGGYVLVGARRPLPGLQGVHWSSGRERAQTLRRLRSAGATAVTPTPRADFDTSSDWRRARRRGETAPLVRR